MDTAQSLGNEASRPEAERIARERAGIDLAEDELANGLYVDFAEVQAWAESLDTEHALPSPPVRRR